MEIIQIANDIHLYGKQAKNFPAGIKEVFEEVIAMVPDGMQRHHFGLSYMENETIIYHAAAEEKQEGEAEKLNCKRYVVKKGDYLSITIHDWMKKLDAFKDSFHQLMQDPRADLTTWCVEWYKSDSEVMCMIKMK